eukprot:CAMPEP_0173105890 /NCGR_PEP_ID=MMETSP1102-20130122/40509_1 /TAXON_ID=49646 /ORGANISM="Geminigera sp., Strain Caron Lab Isolate" /LENGTH=193 /DNA_ID=CAMNT_0014002491 /DNA_START=128 /DNA_END=709 /DNA_ORIENTATION=+
MPNAEVKKQGMLLRKALLLLSATGAAAFASCPTALRAVTPTYGCLQRHSSATQKRGVVQCGAQDASGEGVPRQTPDQLEASITTLKQELRDKDAQIVQLQAETKTLREEVAATALTGKQRQALEESLSMRQTDEIETALLLREMKEMGLSRSDMEHVLRERNRIKPPKPGEKAWSQGSVSKNFAKFFGLHAIE